jgi:hypothetical protein
MWILKVIPTDPSKRRKIDHRVAFGGTGISQSSINRPCVSPRQTLCGGYHVRGSTTRASGGFRDDRTGSRQKGAIETHPIEQRCEALRLGAVMDLALAAAVAHGPANAPKNLDRCNGYKNPSLSGYE